MQEKQEHSEVVSYDGGGRMNLRAVVVGEYAVSRIIKGFVRAGLLGVRPP